jgi:hypothetical protein
VLLLLLVLLLVVVVVVVLVLTRATGRLIYAPGSLMIDTFRREGFTTGNRQPCLNPHP